MNRRIIWISGVVMGVSIMGLLLAQLVWIKNALLVKQKQFDQIVIQSLTNVAEKVGQYQDLSYMFGKEFSYQYDTTFYSSYTDDDQKSVRSRQQFSFNIRVGDKKAGLSENNADHVRDMKKVIHNFFDGVDNIEHVISKQELYKFILTELKSMGVNLHFEHAIKKPDNKFVLKSDNFSSTQKSYVYKVKMYTSSFFSEPNYLWIYFPARKKYLFQSLGYVTISMIFFILVLIISFILLGLFILKQKKLSEIKNDFISNMTHELKTPISTISLASQMLNDKSIPSDTKNTDYISNLIKDESKRLGYQVEKVLQTAIQDKGMIKLRVQKIDVHEVLENVVHNFEIQVDKKNGEVIKKLNASNSLIMADEVHLNNVLLNLLDNAIKYSNVDPKITIKTYNEEDHIIIMIKDNGIGISKRDQKRIFEKFFRISTGNVHNVKGFGLGLFYVKNIIEGHNGSIILNSELHKGSEFKIKLQTIETD